MTTARASITALAPALALLAASPAHAATAQIAEVRAVVLDTIQFAVLLDMNFGRVGTNGSAGAIVLDADAAARTCDPGLVCTGTFALSELRLTGSDADVVVNFAPSFMLTGPGQAMTAVPNFPGGPGTVIHLTGGSAVVRFGSTLYINPNQAPGVYSGNFAVMLEYN